MAWIDVGAAATDRASSITVSANTIVGLANPANLAGVLGTVEVWSNTTITGCKVGTFYGSAGTFTMRDYATVGTVTSGAKRTFSDLSIDVEPGDYIGIVGTAGAVDRITSGGSGIYSYIGDAFTGGAVSGFNLLAGDVSLYGIGYQQEDAACVVSLGSSVSAIPTGPEYATAEIDTASSVEADGAAIYYSSVVLSIAAALSSFASRVLPSAVVSILVPGTSLTVEGQIQKPATASLSVISSLDADGKLTASGAIIVTVAPSLALLAASILDGIGSITSIASLFAQCIGTQYCTINIETVPSLAALAHADYNSAACAITAVSSLDIAALAYVTQTLGFTGTLSAGDVLVIDTDSKTVKLNGVNARESFTGDFWKLYAGTNELAWHDDDGSRTVGLEVDHKPRWL